jgi:2-oxoglutarate ferredoxin oxidoreductase subunit alpha
MDLLETVPSAEALSNSPQIINDFSIVVATVNGTGSQTSNLALLRALFKMGIPVNGKNIFPSNIQGAPTWYHIRLSKEGYEARRDNSEILVGFNQTTFAIDSGDLPAGGVCIYNADWGDIPRREDVTYYGIPVNQLVRHTGMRGKLRDYVSNMVYVGALAQLLQIPLSYLNEALNHLLGSRPALVDPNMDLVRAAHVWTGENIAKRDPYHVREMNGTQGKIMITGNEAAAMGAVFGGVTLVAWYPITPSTSLIDALGDYLKRFRIDPETGKATYAVIQAEDELAAIGIILGAGYAGARAMTATSGPGISLMAEFAGLGYFAELPAVIWDIQRVGPSTGLPTRTSQGDVISTYYLGHGDTKNVILFPATVQECFDFGVTAFDLADTLQTPVFVLSDLDLGMNQWMSQPFEYPAEPIRRGKLLSPEELSDTGFRRYEDLDGDGVGYRTLPGNQHPLAAWLGRGTGHNEAAVYSEKPQDYVDTMDRLQRKFETARRVVPAPVVDEVAGARIGIIAYGTTLYAIDEARDRLADAGIQTSFMRLRALPVDSQLQAFLERYERVYVVEMNHDGQMHRILQAEAPEEAAKLISVAHMDGLPMTSGWLVARLWHLIAG